MTVLYLAADPGGICGIAYTMYDPFDFTRPYGVFHAYEQPAMKAMEKVENLLQTFRNNAIVLAETYTINAYTVKHSRQYDALEAIGVLRFLSIKFGAKFTQQAPAHRNIVTNDVLKKLEWYNPSKDKHMIDAAKHLVVLCMRERLLPAEVLRV